MPTPLIIFTFLLLINLTGLLCGLLSAGFPLEATDSLLTMGCLG
jgi:hypothetical protein